MPTLYIDRKTSEIKLENEALVFYDKGQRSRTIPLAPIERIIIKGNSQVSCNIFRKLGEKGIGIIFLSGRTNTPTLFMPRPHNDATRRIMQYLLSRDPSFKLAFSKMLMRLKLQMQSRWIWEISQLTAEQSIKDTVKEIYQNIINIQYQENISQLMGLEGRSALVYFAALSKYLPTELEFHKRKRRPPTDPFNAIISLSYTILHSEIVLSLYSAGFDPYIGFYHCIDYSRESLACDIIEPFRPIIDKWATSLFTNKILTISDFNTVGNACLLGKEGRIKFYSEYEKKAEEWRKILTINNQGLTEIIKWSKLQPQEQLTQEYQWQTVLDNYAQKFLTTIEEHFITI